MLLNIDGKMFDSIEQGMELQTLLLNYHHNKTVENLTALQKYCRENLQPYTKGTMNWKKGNFYLKMPEALDVEYSSDEVVLAGYDDTSKYTCNVWRARSTGRLSTRGVWCEIWRSPSNPVITATCYNQELYIIPKDVYEYLKTALPTKE